MIALACFYLFVLQILVSVELRLAQIDSKINAGLRLPL
jgi:hypothetical protein